ncbi:MAG: hypothetical protein RIS35_910 [Pseudomonadota bacterium]|jgi:transcriptional regulator with XRE-family HTH domain
MASTPKPPFPPELGSRLEALGHRIREARTRRQLRQADLAERTGLSRSTIEAIERGNPDTSIGAFARALWVMGLDRELDIVADPAIDRDGAALEYTPGERRVRVRRPLDNDF